MRTRLILLVVGFLALWAELSCASGKKQPFSARGKPGKCPVPKGFGTCVEECFSDHSCPGREKCCSNGCGHVCRMPIFREKPGECPKFKLPPGRPCNKFCLQDRDCKGTLKCCKIGCGTVCFQPGTS